MPARATEDKLPGIIGKAVVNRLTAKEVLLMHSQRKPKNRAALVDCMRPT